MENKLYLYFVAFKHEGKIRGFLFGPFARATDATDKIEELKTNEYDDRFVVVRIATPILDVFIMD